MTRVASINFSRNPNLSEARFDIYRRQQGARELWSAYSFGVESLPYPPEELLGSFERHLRYLAPKDDSDLEELDGSRGLERAIADLLRIVGADSGCFIQIETEWFANFDPIAFCREISEQILPTRSNWAQLSDRILEDESALFCTLIPDEPIRSRLFASGLYSLNGGVLEVPMRFITDLPIPAGVEKTGIIIDSGTWVLLAGDPGDRIFVPFAVEWTLDLELRLVPYLPTLETEGGDSQTTDIDLRRFRTPSGPVLSFFVTEESPAGEVRVDPELLPRPTYERLLSSN